MSVFVRQLLSLQLLESSKLPLVQNKGSAVKFLAMLLYIFTTPLFAYTCNQQLNDLLLTRSTILENFKNTYSKQIEQHIQEDTIDLKLLDKNSLIYARNKFTEEPTYILNTNKGLLAFSEGKTFFIEASPIIGFTNKTSPEDTFDLIYTNFLIKSLNGRIALMPTEQFSENEVAKLAKVTSPNQKFIKKWEKELSKLVQTPYLNGEGEMVAIPASALTQAKFIDIKSVDGRTEPMTLFIVNNQLFYLTKEIYPWLATSSSVGKLEYSNLGYLNKSQPIIFKTVDGQTLNFSKSGLSPQDNRVFQQIADAMRAEPQLAKNAQFVETFKDELADMFSELGLDIKLLNTLQVFKRTDRNEYVILINNTPYYFAKGGSDYLETNKNWSLLNPSKMGFRSQYYQEIELEGDLLLKFRNDGVAQIFPQAEKSSQFLDQLINNQEIDKQIRTIVKEFLPEFKKLLKTTELTKSDFLSADIKVALDRKTQTQIIIFNAGKLQVLLSQKTIAQDTLFANSRMAILNDQQMIGFGALDERLLDVPGLFEIKISNKAVSVIPADKKKFAYEMINSLLSPEEQLSSFLKEMLEKNKDQIIELVSRGELQIEQLLPPNSSFGKALKSNQTFWVVKAESKTFLFDLTGSEKAIVFMNLDTEKHGDRIILDSADALTQRRTMGFISKLEEGGDILEQHEYLDVMHDKAQYLIDRVLTKVELQKLVEAKHIDISQMQGDFKTMDEVYAKLFETKKEHLKSAGSFSEKETDILLDNITF